MACEDYPCCGHGPPPQGDGGGCPRIDSEGREIYRCTECRRELPPNARSSICESCQRLMAELGDEYYELYDHDEL